MGVLSDIHVRGTGGSLEPFVRALAWFDAAKVDGVVIAGDLADFGLVEQLKLVGDAWNGVFPDNRAKDGRSVEKVFVTGNHDHHFYNHRKVQKLYPDEKERFERSLAKDFNAAWMSCFGEPYAPVSQKIVKGYPFVLRQYGEKGLSAFVKRQSFDPAKPLFYVQHLHLLGTCYGRESDRVADKGDTKNVLEAFPQCIAFSGHTHYPLTDADCLWRGAFTALGAGSLQYVVRRLPTGETASDVKSHHGMLMDVYDDRVVFARRNFQAKSVESLGGDLVIPLRKS